MEEDQSITISDNKMTIRFYSIRDNTYKTVQYRTDL